MRQAVRPHSGIEFVPLPPPMSRLEKLEKSCDNLELNEFSGIFLSFDIVKGQVDIWASKMLISHQPHTSAWTDWLSVLRQRLAPEYLTAALFKIST